MLEVNSFPHKEWKSSDDDVLGAKRMWKRMRCIKKIQKWKAKSHDASHMNPTADVTHERPFSNSIQFAESSSTSDSTYFFMLLLLLLTLLGFFCTHFHELLFFGWKGERIKVTMILCASISDVMVINNYVIFPKWASGSSFLLKYSPMVSGSDAATFSL